MLLDQNRAFLTSLRSLEIIKSNFLKNSGLLSMRCAGFSFTASPLTSGLSSSNHLVTAYCNVWDNKSFLHRIYSFQYPPQLQRSYFLSLCLEPDCDQQLWLIQHQEELDSSRSQRQQAHKKANIFCFRSKSFDHEHPRVYSITFSVSSDLPNLSVILNMRFFLVLLHFLLSFQIFRIILLNSE